LRSGRNRPRGWSFVHRSRPRLRNDHPRCRRMRRRWCNCAGCRCWRPGHSRSCHHRRGRRGWRNDRCGRRNRRTRGCNRRRRGRSYRLLDNRRRNGRLRCRNWSRGRRGWLRHRWCNCRLRCHRRRSRATRRWMLDCLFLLRDGLEHVSRPGDVREIDLGLDFFFAAQRTRGSGGWRRLGRAAEVRPHLFRFMLLERTGMRFLLGHSHERQHVENGLALDFQLSGEIVDSNLAHPAFLLPRIVA